MSDTTKTLREAADAALAVLVTASSFLSKKARDRAPKVIADLRAALAAQAQAEPVQPVAVPAGWALVPVEITPQMIAALVESEYPGEWAKAIQADIAESFAHFSKWWAAMLAAAPTAPKRERMTDEQILACLASTTNEPPVRLPLGWVWFARAIERAHGIGQDAPNT